MNKGEMATKLMLAAIVLGAFWPVVYSYLEWRREKEDAGGGNPSVR